MRWVLILVLLVGLALVLQAGLVAFAGYVVLGSYVLSRWLSRRWIEDLAAVRQCEAEPREVGDSLEVTVQLRNAGYWPILWVLVEDFVPEEFWRQRPPAVQVKGSRLQVVSLGPGQERILRYRVTFLRRGYYPIGPTLLESGDVFGLHRRFRVVGRPTYVLVLPRMLPIQRYDFVSRRPIGEIRLHHRLFEDPTRTAGVREYQTGDPLSRVHWKATARTGQLHCRVYEPTSLAGATLLLDFHQGSYPARGEPYRSELAITTAASLAYALSLQKQPLGLVSNGRDAAARIREESRETTSPTVVEQDRDRLHQRYALGQGELRLRPVVMETRRGVDQLIQVRETLARLELNDGLTFGALVSLMAPRLPRDATVLALLPQVPVEAAVALGLLRRLGFAVSVLLILPEEVHVWEACGRLTAEGIHDVRVITSEADVIQGGQSVGADSGPAPYALDIPIA